MRYLAKLASTVIAAITGFFAACPVAAADFPDRPVRIIVPYSVGTATEAAARQLGDRLAKVWHQGVVVEAIPGAGGIVGTQAIAKAAPDGYTLGIVAGAHAANPALGPVPYDPLKDFTPVMNIAYTSLVLVVNPNLPYRTARELVAAAKAKPKSITYGTGGTGSAPHMAMEDFMSRAGIDMTHVPYKSLGQLTTDLLGGQIDASMQAVNTFLPQIQAGKVRALGVTGPSSFPLLPDVPPLKDAVPGYVSQIWIGMIAPAGVPDAVVRRIFADASAILKTEEMKQALIGQGIEVDVQPADAFWKQVAADIEKWSVVAKRAGISGR